MRLRHLFQAAVLATSLAFAGAAFADDPQAFVRTEQEKIQTMLRQPASAERDAKVRAELAGIIDYDEMTRRAFGPHWDELSEAQRVEVSAHLRQIIENNYKRNLIKTLDYDITYRGSRPGENGETKVRTHAKHKPGSARSREPAVQIEYMVRTVNGHTGIVDIITENSRLVVNYGDQFHRMLTTEGQKYPYLVQQLRQKAANPGSS